MATKRRILTVTLLIAFLCFASWLILSQPSEPVYQGKPLSYWCDQYAGMNGRNLTSEIQAEAGIAIRSIGTNAIPTLLRWLEARDSKFKLKLIRLSQKHHLIEFDFRTADFKHLEAELGFNCLGSLAKSAVPALIETYNEHLSDTDPSVRNLTVVVLIQIHARPDLTVPALTKSLHDQDEKIRANSSIGLGTFGSDAKPAIPELIKLLADPSTRVSGAAADALLKIDPEAAAKAGVK